MRVGGKNRKAEAAVGDVQILRHFCGVRGVVLESGQPFCSLKIAGNVAVNCKGCSLGEFQVEGFAEKLLATERFVELRNPTGTLSRDTV